MLFVSICRCYNNVLRWNREKFKGILVLVLQFSNYSELKPNFLKTKTIWIGSEPQSSEILCPNFKIKRTKYASNILGIKFGSSLTNINEINFEPKLALEK